MAAYLAYDIVYKCFVNGFTIRKYVDVTVELVQLWCPTLWRHKAPFFVYQFYGSFLRKWREILIGEAPAPITKEAQYFFSGEGQLYIEEEHTYFWLYGFEGTPFLLPRFVID